MHRAAHKQLSEERAAAEWRAIERVRDQFRPEVARIVRRLFAAQEREVLATFTGKRFFDPQKWIDLFKDGLLSIVLSMFQRGAEVGFEQAGVEPREIAIPFDRDVFVRQIVRSELINRETSKQVIALLEDGVRQGRSIRQMRSDLRKLFKGFRKFRTDRIVNTVVVGSFEAGTLAAWQAEGIERKEWVAARDDRTRETHLAANGQQADIAEPFQVGQALLMHPGDPDGPAREVINCRCTMAPIV